MTDLYFTILALGVSGKSNLKIRTSFPIGLCSKESIPFFWREIPICDAAGLSDPVVEIHIPQNNGIVFTNGGQNPFLRFKCDRIHCLRRHAKTSDQFVGRHVPDANVAVRTAGRQNFAVGPERNA